METLEGGQALAIRRAHHQKVTEIQEVDFSVGDSRDRPGTWREGDDRANSHPAAAKEQQALHAQASQEALSKRPDFSVRSLRPGEVTLGSGTWRRWILLSEAVDTGLRAPDAVVSLNRAGFLEKVERW
eukprot:m.162020 g.162020  ORF g.162020 m.162020 type:complete len:128 (+) comp53057_c0_seq7:466-849(+)